MEIQSKAGSGGRIKKEFLEKFRASCKLLGVGREWGERGQSAQILEELYCLNDNEGDS